MPRDIPPQKWYNNFCLNFMIASVIPSLVIYYELNKILSAIKGAENMTIMFWFVYVAVVLYVLVVAEVSVT